MPYKIEKPSKNQKSNAFSGAGRTLNGATVPAKKRATTKAQKKSNAKKMGIHLLSALSENSNQQEDKSGDIDDSDEDEDYHLFDDEEQGSKQDWKSSKRLEGKDEGLRTSSRIKNNLFLKKFGDGQQLGEGEKKAEAGYEDQHAQDGE